MVIISFAILFIIIPFLSIHTRSHVLELVTGHSFLVMRNATVAPVQGQVCSWTWRRRESAHC